MSLAATQNVQPLLIPVCRSQLLCTASFLDLDILGEGLAELHGSFQIDQFYRLVTSCVASACTGVMPLKTDLKIVDLANVNGSVGIEEEADKPGGLLH